MTSAAFASLTTTRDQRRVALTPEEELAQLTPADPTRRLHEGFATSGAPARWTRDRAQRRLIVRTGAMTIAAAGLLALIELLAAGAAVTVCAPAAISLLGAVALMLAGKRLPVAGFPILCILLVALDGYVVRHVGAAAGGVMMYVLPVLWVACFFERRQTLLVLCAVGLAQALALAGSPGAIHFASDWFGVMVPAAVVAVLTTALAENHWQLLADSEAKARVDQLTGLVNRRGLLERADLELARARRQASIVSVVAFDVDHFKRINDAYGHDSGDQVLARLGEIMRQHVRGIDVAARTGGEEFVLLLPSCGPADARVVADRVRDEFARRPIAGIPRVTVSAGIASELSPGELKPLLLAADRALYEAKAAGRDCTWVASAGTSQPVGS